MQIYQEHEFEAAPGLPEALPAGERILWQGSPDWKRLAVEALHVRSIAAYFVAMIVLQALLTWDATIGTGANLASLSIGATLAALALCLLALTAWLSASTTMYTITNRRVVMRIGIVLTLSFNLPLRCLKAAHLKPQADGFGDIALELDGEDRIAYLHLWPHARAWYLKNPQPALRCIAGAAQVGQLLNEAWQQRQQQGELATSSQREGLIPVRMPASAYAR